MYINSPLRAIAYTLTYHPIRSHYIIFWLFKLEIRTTTTTKTKKKSIRWVSEEKKNEFINNELKSSFFLIKTKAVATNLSFLLSTTLILLLIALMQLYKVNLGSTQLMTIIGGFLGSMLFVSILTVRIFSFARWFLVS